MKILSWNCRGLSRPAAVQTLRRLIRDQSTDILFLTETKSSPLQVSVTLNRPGFFLMSQVAPIGSSGGLVLFWRPGVDLECFVTNKNNISAWCFSDPLHSPWIMSCIYEPPDRKDRLAFWASFESFGSLFEAPWLCIGDFNSVLDQTEKLGGHPVSSTSNCPFRNFINLFGMIDLGFVGNPYTWSNNRQGMHLIKERLDRGLASPNWIHLHPEYFLLHLPALTSDHNPISLTTNNSSCFLPRPFRFEEFWSKDSSCADIIEAAWLKSVFSIPTKRLPKKLKNTKLAFLEWNSKHFGNIQNQIKATLQNLDLVQQAPPSSLTYEKEISLKLELGNLLSKEEILWRSKSREIWLTCKDLNTKYFHTSTLIRRRSNAINFSSWILVFGYHQELILVFLSPLILPTCSLLQILLLILKCLIFLTPSSLRRITTFCALFLRRRK